MAEPKSDASKTEPTADVVTTRVNIAFPFSQIKDEYHEFVSSCGSEECARDLPLNFHPAAFRASTNVTPFGAVSVPA